MYVLFYARIAKLILNDLLKQNEQISNTYYRMCVNVAQWRGLSADPAVACIYNAVLLSEIRSLITDNVVR